MNVLKIINMSICIIVLVALVGFLIYATANGGFDGFFSGGSSNYEVIKEESVDAQELKVIDVDLDRMDIHLYKTDKTEVKVIQRSNQNPNKQKIVSIHNEMNKLSITQEKVWFSFFNFNFHKDKLELYLPTTFTGEILIRNTSGNVNLPDELTLESFTLKMSSGNLEVKEKLTVDRLNAAVTSGDLRLNTVEAKSYEMKSTSGRITAESLTGDGTIYCTSGDIIVSKLSGSGMYNTVSGNITVSFAEIKKASGMGTISGNVNLSLAKDMNFLFKGKCISGNVSANFDIDYTDNSKKNEATAKFGDGQYYIDVSITSGNIRLELAE